MAGRYILGFEDLDTAGLTYEAPQIDGPGISVVNFGRTATKCLEITNGGHAIHFVAIPEGAQTIHFGFTWYAQAITGSVETIAMFSGWTATHMMLAITASGNLRWYRYGLPQYTKTLAASVTQVGSTGATNLQLNTWYWLSGKLKIHDTTGIADLYINDVLELSNSNVDTLNGPEEALVVAVGFASHSGVGSSLFIDGLVVSDDSAGENDYVPVDGRVDCHKPNADGNSSQWSRSTGSLQYATIDDADPDGDTTYNSTSTLNARDTVGVENFLNPGATIFWVQVDLISRKDDIGTCQISPVVRIDGVDYVGDAKSPGQVYSKQRQSYDVMPNSNVWAEDKFNLMQVGYEKTA